MIDDSIRCRFCHRPLMDAVCACGHEEVPHDALGSEDLEGVLRERDQARSTGPHFGMRSFTFAMLRGGARERV